MADEAIHVNTCQGDVCDKHFHGMSDVKNLVDPLVKNDNSQRKGPRDFEVGKAKRIEVEEAAEVSRGEQRGRGKELVLYKSSTSSSVPHPRPHPHPRPCPCPP